MMDRAAQYFQDLQDRIVAELERLDGKRFREDVWQRPGGGGGRTRVLADGAIFERAGVNFSDVHGELRPDFAGTMPGEGARFRATGVSLVLHPRNPHVPTVHANFRRIERGGAGWFGGGADLTPYYVRSEDATHFHRVLKGACNSFEANFFSRWKAWCDDYFFITHRGEPRGVGGIFFDYLGVGSEKAAGRSPVAETLTETDPERAFSFVKTAGDAFIPAYTPIVERRLHEPFGEAERRWQLLRRGRYVEFNLVYDRGTVFGLRTDGRVESILMSLPPEARWEYAHEPVAGTPEAESLKAIRDRIDWAERDT